MSEEPQSAPRIVALETSGRVGSVALALGGRLVAERHFAQGMRHAVALMPTLRALCQEQGWLPETLAQIFISEGPGSFTGLRIAVMVARSLAQAVGCRIVAVPTVDVLASNAPPEAAHVAVILDAKRHQVFAARYARHPGAEPGAGAGAEPGAAADTRKPDPERLPNGLVRVAGPALVDPAEFIRATPRPVWVTGEGVEYHRPALRAGVDADTDLLEVPKDLWPGRAAAVHALGWARAQRGQFVPPESLIPVYIRLAEAEEVWRKRHGLM